MGWVRRVGRATACRQAEWVRRAAMGRVRRVGRATACRRAEWVRRAAMGHPVMSCHARRPGAAARLCLPVGPYLVGRALAVHLARARRSGPDRPADRRGAAARLRPLTGPCPVGRALVGCGWPQLQALGGRRAGSGPGRWADPCAWQTGSDEIQMTRLAPDRRAGWADCARCWVVLAGVPLQLYLLTLTPHPDRR
jgi:hypothetical protein